MVIKQNRKGAVEMSLNLIIMLIIGMVVLGLVIGFVNSLVNDGSEVFENQIGEQDQLKLDEVANCRDNLCVIPEPSITVTKGANNRLYLKVRNYKGDGAISCNAGPLQNCEVNFIVVDNEGNEASGFTLSGPGFPDMKSGQEESRMYTFGVDESVVIGTYYMTIGLYDDSESPVVLTVNVE